MYPNCLCSLHLLTTQPWTMASLGQYCTRNCLNSKNSFSTFSVSQPRNARQYSNIVTNRHSSNHRPTCCRLSSKGKKHLISIFPLSKVDRWRQWCSDDGSCGIAPFSPQIPSALDLVDEFYKAINVDDTETLDEKLDQILSDDCEYQDLFFYIPFKGKQVFCFFFSPTSFVLSSYQDS